MCYNQIVERTYSPIDEKNRIPTIGKRDEGSEKHENQNQSK